MPRQKQGDELLPVRASEGEMWPASEEHSALTEAHVRSYTSGRATQLWGGRMRPKV
jgi:hypothetical protein